MSELYVLGSECEGEVMEEGHPDGVEALYGIEVK